VKQTTSQIDERMMSRAIALARRGYPAPNPHVGCVIAQGDEILGEGFHDYAGGPHAEVVALRKAKIRARNATAYVTMEPCNHHGRTPPCVDALLEAGIARVVVSGADPTPVGGGGLARLAMAGVTTESGFMAQEARASNLLWLTAIERGWPYVVVKAAMTLDGRIATQSGESKWITGESARKEAHRLRAECGAVLAGRTTVEKDDPHLTVRTVRIQNQPTRIVLDPGRKIAPNHHVFDSEAQTIRVVAGEARSGEIKCGYKNGYLDLKELLATLFVLGITSVLVEGGAHTIGSFFDAGLVDRLELFIAGKVFGAGITWVERPFTGPVAGAPGFNINRIRKAGEDLWLTCVPERV
jgi:diaminohydroxyphosphoribosylaminopyrimidine deaminase/5-amino-6-(5-phosphoribosylamino)uracil reductase